MKNLVAVPAGLPLARSLGTWVDRAPGDALRGPRQPLEEQRHEIVPVLHVTEATKGRRQQPHGGLLLGLFFAGQRSA